MLMISYQAIMSNHICYYEFDLLAVFFQQLFFYGSFIILIEEPLSDKRVKFVRWSISLLLIVLLKSRQSSSIVIGK